jgi:hypothetical protein
VELKLLDLSFGGLTSPPLTNRSETEEYDGSTWSPGGSLNTARRYLKGCGTQTAALAFGGFTTTTITNTEEYNGATWTSSNPMV